MSFPGSDPLFEDETPLPPARRRRQQRSLIPENQDERSEWLESMARQLTPSYDFFLSCVLSGIILAAAFLLNSGALLVLGLLFSPFLGPVIGIALSITTGSARFLFQSMLALVAAAAFIFGFGALGGALAPIYSDVPIAVITEWSTYDWPNFLVIAIGAGLSAYMLVRSPGQKPLVPSIAIAYGLFPPLAAAGYNLTAFSGNYLSQDVLTAGVHLVWALLIATLMFIILGQTPRLLSGYLLTALLAGLLVAALMSSSTPDSPVPTPMPTWPMVIGDTPAPTTIAPPPPVTATDRPVTATASLTTTITLAPTGSPTVTITPQSTPVYARVAAQTGGGAYLRDQPDGKIITSILNGSMLEVISEPVVGARGVIWVQVRTEDGLEAWIVQNLLATATPSVGW